MQHQAALPALAFKWIRILYRYWVDRVPYDESRYLLALRKRQAPLLKVAAWPPNLLDGPPQGLSCAANAQLGSSASPGSWVEQVSYLFQKAARRSGEGRRDDVGLKRFFKGTVQIVGVIVEKPLDVRLQLPLFFERCDCSEGT
jgi:hypothetical protein